MAQRLSIQEMTLDESVQMLTQYVPAPPADLAPFQQLARRLGEWPLLLKLTTSALKARLDRGNSIGAALEYVNQALDRGGVTAFDRVDTEQRNAAVASRWIEIRSPPPGGG